MAPTDPGVPRTGALSVWPPVTSGTESIATVYRCVKLLSESVANLPVQFLKRRDGIFVPDDRHPLAYLLNVQPDRAMSAFDFWRQAIREVLLGGNAYIVPFYDTYGSAPELYRLALCGRGCVSHDTAADTYSVSDAVNDIYGTFGEDEIIHIKGLTGRDYKTGVSVLTHAAMTMGIASAGDRETRDRFENGGSVRGLVSNNKSVRGFGPYQDAELQRTAVDLDEYFRSGHRIASLPGDSSWQPISLSSTDMQFLESRKFTVREICRFFGVHPSFVFDDTSNNYKSAEQANVAFLSHTLNPLLRCIETELLRKLVAPGLAYKYRILFDRRGLYACDLESKARYQTARLANGTASVNELRLEENRPPVDGGDQILVSANLRGISEITAPAAAPEPNPQNTDPNEGTDPE